MKGKLAEEWRTYESKKGSWFEAFQIVQQKYLAEFAEISEHLKITIVNE